MFAISLQSGSNGNCTYVEAGGARLLFDAGISGIQASQRLAAHGLDINRVDALIISHDHTDHVRSAGIYQRKYGVPIYITRKTLEKALSYNALGPLDDVRHFRSGETISVKDVAVETIPTAHDGADGSAFVIDLDGKRLGIFTDLGYAFEGIYDAVSTLDGVFLESNYDPGMLASGPYPEFLKKRIKGPGGHLSNFEAAELLCLCKGRLKWACLSHLSEQNNSPELAIETHRSIVGRGLPIHAASRYFSSGIFRL